MMFENTDNPKNQHILEVLRTLSGLNRSILDAKLQLDKIEEPIQSIGYQMEGNKVFSAKMIAIINASLEHSVENVVETIIKDMQAHPSEYVEGDHADELNLWQALCCILHSEEYFYENDFLFSLSKELLNETEVTIHTEFTDESERQKSFGEAVFSIIETHRAKLKDYEKAIIWGLENDADGNEWFFSEEEHDSELTWNDDFIDNHLYSMIIQKAQSGQGVH